MASTTSTKERILTSALDLIYARSYAAVGVQEVCEHAGVKKGSFYHFFRSKRDLTLATLERQWDTVKKKIFEPCFSSTLSPLGQIEQCFVLLADFQAQIKAKTGHVYGCPFGNLATELSSHDEVIRKKIDRIFQAMEGYFEEALRKAITHGEMRPRDTRAGAQTLIAYLEGSNMLAKTRNNPALIKQHGHDVVRLLAGETPVTRKLSRRSI